MKRVIVVFILLLGAASASAQSNFGNNKVQAGSTCPPVSAPLSGTGTLYTCTGNGALYTWTGSVWSLVAGGGGGPASPSTSVQYNAAGSFSGSSTFTYNPADQVAETPNLQLFNNSSGTQGYLMEVDSTSISSANPELFYPRMFHSVFNMNGTGTIAGKRVMPASLEVYNNTTGSITWSSSAEVYGENISSGNWSTMLGIGSRLFNDSTGTVSRMVAFATSETDHFQNGNYGNGVVTYYAAFEGNGVNDSGTYGAVYGLHLLDQSGLTVTGNNHAINYNDTFIVDSTGAVYNGLNSSKAEDVDATDYAAPVLAGAGAGNVSNGTHRYKITYESQDGTIHTAGGAPSNAVTVVNNAVNGKVTVTVPALCLSPQKVLYVRVYRDKDSDGVYKLVDTAGACFRTMTDNVADGSLGATVPTTNNSENPILLFSDASVGNNATADRSYNHNIPLYNPPNPGHSSDEFAYYYIFPQDRLTTDIPHKGILFFGNFNSAPDVTMYETEGGHMGVQGGAQTHGGFGFLCGGAGFSNTDGADSTEASCITLNGSTATASGSIEISTGAAFAAATNLNGGDITIKSGAPANSGHYGDITIGPFRNETLTGSGSLTITGGMVAPAASGTRFLCISTTGVVTSSSSACSGT